MLTLFTYARVREIMGQHWNEKKKKCMRDKMGIKMSEGQNGHKNNVWGQNRNTKKYGAKLGYDIYSINWLRTLQVSWQGIRKVSQNYNYSLQISHSTVDSSSCEM
jgi:hypothetical protein